MSTRIRHEKNCAGPFYVEADECLDCCIVESVAGPLMPNPDETGGDCYFQRQPENAEEVEWACQAVLSCCTRAVRYGGTDEAIIRRLYNAPQHSDHTFNNSGQLVLNCDRVYKDVTYSDTDRLRWNMERIAREGWPTNGAQPAVQADVP